MTVGSVTPSLELFPGIYRGALEALADLPVRVLVTVGRDRDPAEVGPLPANARVEGCGPPPRCARCRRSTPRSPRVEGLLVDRLAA